MVAIYLKERFGLPNEQILRELPLFGHAFHSPRYEKMREFVLSYGTAGQKDARHPRSPAECDHDDTDASRRVTNPT
jgi:hypothetical protein